MNKAQKLIHKMSEMDYGPVDLTVGDMVKVKQAFEKMGLQKFVKHYLTRIKKGVPLMAAVRHLEELNHLKDALKIGQRVVKLGISDDLEFEVLQWDIDNYK